MKKFTAITMYSTSWCADCFRAKNFFTEHEIEFSEIDIEKNPEAADVVEKINNGNRSVPTIVFKQNDSDDNASEIVKVEPSTQELEELFELN